MFFDKVEFLRFLQGELRSVKRVGYLKMIEIVVGTFHCFVDLIPLQKYILLDSFMLILNKVHSIRNDEEFCPPLVSPVSTNNRSSYNDKCSCSAHYIRDFHKLGKINIIGILCKNKNSSNKMLPRVRIEPETSDSKSDTPSF